MFFFFPVFLDLSSIKMIRSFFKELIFFNSLTNVPFFSPKCCAEMAKSGHTAMLNESIQTYPKTTDYDHSNYR